MDSHLKESRNKKNLKIGMYLTKEPPKTLSKLKGMGEMNNSKIIIRDFNILSVT